MHYNPLTNEIYLKRSTDRLTDARGDYFRDQTAIIHSSAFRRLKHKTQVFFAPENDHICTRIEHVLHVATIAATICKGLNSKGWHLDTDMAYAIGLGHDLGHTPFGHAGEKALNRKLGENNNFIHEVNSYRVVEHLSNNGEGLNLTYGVKDGIICHNGERDEQRLKPNNKPNNLEEIKNRKCTPSSYEGCIMRFSDKIAYLGRDIEDALIANIIKIEQIPASIENELGNKNGQIINNLVIDLIENSSDSDYISFSDEKYELVTLLKKFNYTHIYSHQKLKQYDDFCDKIVCTLFDHFTNLFLKNTNQFELYQKDYLRVNQSFGAYYQSMLNFYGNLTDPTSLVVDYISGMTDKYALESIKQITIPAPIIFSK